MSKSALFVWGGWEGHQPQQCVEAVAPLIHAAGLKVRISDSLSSFDDPEALRRCDVIIPCWTMGQLTEEQERSLLAAVRAGCGLAGWHGGTGDAFRSSSEFQFAVGGQFVAHPGGIVDYGVEIIDQDHPVTCGLESFNLRSEQYYMHVDPSNHVLAETVFSGEHAPWIAGCRMPVVWTRRYGEGRVFYCSVGHDAGNLQIPAVSEIVRRGILWAANAM